MRKSLEAISLGMIAILFWITWRGLNGPERLAGPIPTHFNAAGEPNAWGPPGALWLLPAIALGLYLFISLVALFPASFNFPVRVTAANRPRLEALTLQMISWLKLELAGLFLAIQWWILASARQGRASLPPLILPLFLVAVFANIGWHGVRVFRAGRDGA